MTLLALGQKAVEIGAVLAFVFGVGWYVAEPRAQDFIKETVKERLQTLEQSVADVQKQQKDAEVQGWRNESDLASIKAKQDAAQINLELILKLIDK